MNSAYCKDVSILLFSDELRANIRSEIYQAKESLENAVRLTNDALQRANEVYDEALTLFANVNAVSTPEINLEKLKKDAADALSEAERLQSQVNDLTKSHESLLLDYDVNAELARILIHR